MLFFLKINLRGFWYEIIDSNTVVLGTQGKSLEKLNFTLNPIRDYTEPD